jgi:hypothetical protein
VTHPNGDDPGTNTILQTQQWNLIGDTQILSFTANPPSIRQFESTTLAWSVKLPTQLHGIIKVGVGSQISASTTGSVVVSPLTNTDFHIVVETPIVSRAIGLCTVEVDTSGCQPPQGISAATINASVLENAQSSFADGSQVSLRGTTSTKAHSGGLDITIPLAISVPDWFDATLDITMAIDVGMDGMPPHAVSKVVLRNLDVDFDWAWYSDVLSLGLTDLASTVANHVAQPLLEHIAEYEVVPQIKSGFDSFVASEAAAAQNLDPTHRAYVLTEFGCDTMGVEFQLCPLLPDNPHPVHPVIPADPVHPADPAH